MPYRRFLVANAAGGLVWAFGTTYLLYSVGRAAEHWLKDISWAGLVLAVLAGLGSTWWLRRRAHRVTSADGASDMTTAECLPRSRRRAVRRRTGGRRLWWPPGVEPIRRARTDQACRRAGPRGGVRPFVMCCGCVWGQLVA